MSPRELLRLSHAFVSHTHMDHFAGFDRLLRVCLHRTIPLHLVGPSGFLDQVEHKLKAYTWNLLDEDSFDFLLTAAEFAGDGVNRICEFRAREAFHRRELSTPQLPPGILLDEEEFRIESVVLDHGTPCLAFAFQEKLRVNVWREGLDLLQLPVGAWLNEAKRAVRRGRRTTAGFLFATIYLSPSACSSSMRCAQRVDTRLPTWSTPLSMRRISQELSSWHAAPTSSSSRRPSWTRMQRLLPKGAISPPRRQARLQGAPAFPGLCRFIFPADTATERIKSGRK